VFVCYDLFDTHMVNHAACCWVMGSWCFGEACRFIFKNWWCGCGTLRHSETFTVSHSRRTQLTTQVWKPQCL